MMRDARVFRAGFVPREVEHRDAEVNRLSSVLKPIANGEPADTAVVTGPSGAGKTCISQFVAERLREEDLDVETIYVNCRRNYTRFSTISARPSISTASRRHTINSLIVFSNTTACEPSSSSTRSTSSKTRALSTTSTVSHSSRLSASRTDKRSYSAASTTASSADYAPASTFGWTSTATSNFSIF